MFFGFFRRLRRKIVLCLCIVGAVIIGMLNNILNLMNVSSYYQTIIKGVVILIAVLLDAKSKEK